MEPIFAVTRPSVEAGSLRPRAQAGLEPAAQPAVHHRQPQTGKGIPRSSTAHRTSRRCRVRSLLGCSRSGEFLRACNRTFFFWVHCCVVANVSYVLLQAAIGDMSNLINEFVTRHPASFAETSTDSSRSRALALSSVHTGLFIGMNDWKRVLGGGLPGRMSNNSCFQLSAKSPIRLVSLPKVCKLTCQHNVPTMLQGFAQLAAA